MNKETAELISRLNASRDTLKKLDIGDYVLIRQARDVMADAANALDSYARTMDRIERLEAEMATIARGDVPPDQHGHYLAHRAAVKIARDALKPA